MASPCWSDLTQVSPPRMCSELKTWHVQRCDGCVVGLGWSSTVLDGVASSCSGVLHVLGRSWMVLVILEHYYVLQTPRICLGSKRVLQDANVLCHLFTEADLSGKPVALQRPCQPLALCRTNGWGIETMTASSRNA